MGGFKSFYRAVNTQCRNNARLSLAHEELGAKMYKSTCLHVQSLVIISLRMASLSGTYAHFWQSALRYECIDIREPLHISMVFTLNSGLESADTGIERYWSVNEWRDRVRVHRAVQFNIRSMMTYIHV